MKRRTLYGLLSVVMVLGLVLAACAPATPTQAPGEEPTEPPMEEPTEEPMEEPTEAPEPEVRTRGAPPNEEIAELLRDAVSETDLETRRAMYEQANQMIHDEVISVPVVHRTPPTLMRTNVSGYVPSPIREVLTYLEDSEDSELVFAMSADAGTLDPALETSANSLIPAHHIYEGLTGFEEGGTTPVPALATEWEASEDATVWTFTLREGVTFHDGTPFNADAVVYNFQRWFDPEHAQHQEGQFIYWNYMFQGVKGEDSVLESIEKVDDMTVQMTLSRPNASLLNTLAMENFRFASPAAVQEQGDTYGTAEGMAVGTGPWMVEEWVKEDHLTLVRNPDYWGEVPTLERLTFRVIPDTSAAFLALQAGEIDMISLWASPSPDDITVAQEDPNIDVVYNPAFNVGYLGLNHAKDWLANRNARLAIAHAIDEQAIIDAIYPGDAEVASQFQPPSLWGYNEDVEDYAYDPELARDLLQQAMDEGVEIPDPAVFYVMPVARAYYPDPQPTGELIQAQLAEVGINAQIQSPAWPDPYISDLTEDGTKHDLFMLGWVGDNGDPDNFLCVFFCGGDTSFNHEVVEE